VSRNRNHDKKPTAIASTDVVLITGLEHELFKTVSWQGQNIGYLIGYTCAMLFLYTLAPILFRLSSSPFYNLR